MLMLGNLFSIQHWLLSSEKKVGLGMLFGMTSTQVTKRVWLGQGVASRHKIEGQRRIVRVFCSTCKSGKMELFWGPSHICQEKLVWWWHEKGGHRIAAWLES